MRRSRVCPRGLLVLLVIVLRCAFAGGAESPVPGTDEIASARALDEQATALDTKGETAEALPLARRALDIRLQRLGPAHPDTASSYYTLAGIYEDSGDLPAAVEHYQKALDIRQAVLGDEHPGTAQVLNAMGNALYQQGKFVRAEEAWQRALHIREKTAPPDSIEIAKPLNNLAALHQLRGEVAEAVDFYRRALAIFEKQLGPDHPVTANTLNNLGVISRELLGDPATADGYLRRALAIRERCFGPEHPLVLATLTNLAGNLIDQHKFAEGVEILQRVLPLYEKAKGPAFIDTLRVRNNLGVGLARLGKLDEAETAGKATLRLTEEALGPGHPQVGSVLINLADLYRHRNSPAEAEACAGRAEGIYRHVFGDDNPDTCLAISLHAGALLDLGRKAEAGALAAQLAHGREKTLGNILSFTSEAQRLTFQSTSADGYSLLATVGDAAALEEAVLRSKGAVLDSLLEDRLVAAASADPGRRQQIEDARTMRRELVHLQLDTPPDLQAATLEGRDARKRELSAKLDAAEGAMAQQVAGVGRARRALGVTVEQVMAALPEKAVLVDFVRYAHDLGHDSATEPSYGAVVLSRDTPPRWTALGDAAKLDDLLAEYRRAVRGEAEDPLALEALLGKLYRTVWRPLQELVPIDAAQVFISPDSELNFLSFATLLTPEDHFLGEGHAITYLGSGRDILPAANAAARQDNEAGPILTVFANPSMQNERIAARTAAAKPSVGVTTSPETGSRLAYRDLRLGPLPGAELEAGVLQRFGRERGWKTEVLTGDAASEARLLAVRHPRILHLATHGFFLPVPGDAAATPSGLGPARPPPSTFWSNPMRRSGLALAGAGSTLDAWAAGWVPKVEEDGIVTAEEVSSLDLHGTSLVVLSACESGGGEVRSGEGVLGLRRGFALAGANDLLLTLWPVGDEETSSLILDFYARAERTHNPGQALAETQREHLVRLRKEQGINAAVRLAGGFILSSAQP